jgi:hypothetical protein
LKVRSLILGAALVAAASSGLIAHADGQACVSLTVVANGETVVDEAQCQPLAPPALPEAPPAP